MKLVYGDFAAQTVSERIAAPVATTAALTAIPASRRVDGMIALVQADSSLWVFNSSSSAGAAAGVLAPDSGSGRWLLCSGGAGSDYKTSVRAASTANVADLTACSTTMDGVTLVANDRVLLKNQSTGSQNGIYVVGTVGGGTAPLTRATDANTSAQVTAGMQVFVSEGTANGNLVFTLTTDDAITLGTTSLTFTQTGGGVATTSVSGLMSSTDKAKLDSMHKGVSYVRGVVYANVSNLSAFTVAGNDGLTYVAGERVLLANQTTAAECGVYTVGTVGGGTAALTRASEMAAGATISNGQIVHVSEGTIWAGSEWKAMATTTGGAVIGTNDPLFYPRICKGVATLSSGVKALGSTEGLFLFSTTKSVVTCTRNTANTSTATTGGYAVPVSTRTAGKSGTAAATITAQAADGSTNTNDVSTIDWIATNW